MAFLARVEGWYPTLAKAKSEEHYRHLLRQTSNQIDLSELRLPGPSAERITRASRSLVSNLDPDDQRKVGYGELAASFVLGIGHTQLTEQLWLRIKATTKPAQEFPMAVVAHCEEVAGWYVLLWYVQPSNAQQPARAWVTPNEGPWEMFFADRPGLWIPLEGIFVSGNDVGAWGYGHKVNMQSLTYLTGDEKKMYEIIQRRGTKTPQVFPSWFK
jgi:hypothetical protein